MLSVYSNALIKSDKSHVLLAPSTVIIIELLYHVIITNNNINSQINKYNP